MRHRIAGWALPLLATATVWMAAPVRASEGRIPVFEPGTYPNSGKYILTRDITATAAGTVLNFTGNGKVDLDLNGFTVTGTGGVEGNGVIKARFLTEFSVRKGRIVGSSSLDGIRTDDLGLVVVEDMTIENAGRGIGLFTTRQALVRRNTVVTAQHNGIVVGGTVAATSVIIVEDNSVEDTGGDGSSTAIAVGNNVDSVTIQRNKVVGSGGNWGISAGGLQGTVEILGNTVQDSTNGGITVQAEGCTVADNVVTNTGGTGYSFFASASEPRSSCVIQRNVATNVTGNGIMLSIGASLIDGNLVNGSTNIGIVLGSGVNATSGYKNNTTVNNAVGCILAPAGNVALGPNHCAP